MNWSVAGRGPSQRLRQCFAALAAVGLNLLFFSMLNMHRERGHFQPAPPKSTLYVLVVPLEVGIPDATPKIPPPGHLSKVGKPDRRRSSSPRAVYVAPGNSTSEAAPSAAGQPQLEGNNHRQAPPTLDLSAEVLQRAAKAARKGAIGGLADAAGVPLDAASSPAQALAEGVKRSARLDCRTAHADKGLLAVPFLLADTVTDKGCRW